MKKHLPFRRPSAALTIASVALFVSLGGVGYAASQLPAGSVGSAQLKTHAVTGNKIDFVSVGFRKIQFGAVGTRRINTSQVQVRVNGVCAAGSAMTAIDNAGNATCASTSPKEFGALAGPVAVNPTATAIAAKALPGGSSYLVFANPQIDVSSAANSSVRIDCTLSMNPGDASTTQTRSVTVQGVAGHRLASLPLMIPAPSVANGSTAAVSCTRTATGTPTVAVSTAINALQTASNG